MTLPAVCVRRVLVQLRLQFFHSVLHHRRRRNRRRRFQRRSPRGENRRFDHRKNSKEWRFLFYSFIYSSVLSHIRELMLFIPGNGRGVFTRLEIVTPEVGRQVESGTSGRGRKWDVRPRPEVGRQAESRTSGRKWGIRTLPEVGHQAESETSRRK